MSKIALFRHFVLCITQRTANFLSLSSDILTGNANSGYDSGVDCPERVVSDEIDEKTKPNTRTDNTSAIFTLQSTVLSESIQDQPTYEISALQSEPKVTLQNVKIAKPLRRKKRKHCLTIRRRKNRPRKSSQLCDETPESCDLITDPREETANLSSLNAVEFVTQGSDAVEQYSSTLEKIAATENQFRNTREEITEPRDQFTDAREKFTNSPEQEHFVSEMFRDFQGVLVNMSVCDTSSSGSQNADENSERLDKVSDNIDHMNSEHSHVNGQVWHVPRQCENVDPGRDTSMAVDFSPNHPLNEFNS